MNKRYQYDTFALDLHRTIIFLYKKEKLPDNIMIESYFFSIYLKIFVHVPTILRIPKRRPQPHTITSLCFGHIMKIIVSETRAIMPQKTIRFISIAHNSNNGHTSREIVNVFYYMN